MSRDLLFVGDRCLLVEPGRLFDVGTADAAQVSALVAALRDDAPTSADHDGRRLLAARVRGTYLDYSADDALDTDRALMADYLTTDPAPPTEPASDGPWSWLPHPAFARWPDRFSALAELLLIGFGVLHDADFLGLFAVPLKAPPSKGARHPFSAYLAVGAGAELPPGLYRYGPSRHTLDRLGPESLVDSGVVLVVTIVFERVQWRYREVAGYCDALLDLGHLVATLRIAAERLGLTLDPGTGGQTDADDREAPARPPDTFPVDTFPVERPLVEEVVLAWRVT